MRTGMSTACFFGREYNEDALRVMGKLGVHDAELFFSANQEYAPQYLHEVRSICNGEGIRIRSVHAMGTPFEPQLLSFHDRQYREALAVYHEVLAAAEFLESSVYVFHGPMFLKRARGFHPDYEFAGERVSYLADLAAQYNVALCYETVHWCWYHFPEFAGELLRHVTSDNLYFTLDLKQAAQSGFSPIDYIDGMDGRLKHVHVCDFTKRPDGSILPCLPFHGQADWGAVRSRLDDVGFDDWLILEVYMNDYSSYGELMDNFNELTQYFAGPADAASPADAPPAPSVD